MRKILLLALCSMLTLLSCDTIKDMPTTTSSGSFSLKGSWQLGSSTQTNSMVGTTISIMQGGGKATIKTIANNTYCVKQNDLLWREIKANNAGGYDVSTLVSDCEGTPVYNIGVINVISNDQVTVTSRTVKGSELIQSWTRIK